MHLLDLAGPVCMLACWKRGDCAHALHRRPWAARAGQVSQCELSTATACHGRKVEDLRAVPLCMEGGCEPPPCHRAWSFSRRLSGRLHCHSDPHTGIPHAGTQGPPHLCRALQAGTLQPSLTWKLTHAAVKAFTCWCRMCTHPLVVDPGPGEEGLRFYAGCPLVASNGFRLGSL